MTNLIIDTDLGSSTDDVATLCMAYEYMRQNKANLLGIIINRMGEQNAEFADVLNTYYGFPNIPIGLCRNGIENPPIFSDYAGIANKRNQDGTTIFKRTITNSSEFLDDYKLYRKILASQPDKSVTIISIGFLTSLANLLQSQADEYSSENGISLVQKKVREFIIMGGKFDESDKNGEYNIQFSAEFAKTFYQLIPNEIPVYYSPESVGNQIYWTRDQILQDFSNVELHPLKQIYLDCPEDPMQRMWDPLTIMTAVEGIEYFQWSEKGYVKLTDDFTLDFIENPTGNTQYQIVVNSTENEKYLNFIRNMIIHRKS
ncbi:MAG: nucleoside hydrolase [Bacteroidales bacterium]|nr:nucleoside hydrolase [Bacteroidales bacterium]